MTQYCTQCENETPVKSVLIRFPNLLGKNTREKANICETCLLDALYLINKYKVNNNYQSRKELYKLVHAQKAGVLAFP